MLPAGWPNDNELTHLDICQMPIFIFYLKKIVDQIHFRLKSVQMEKCVDMSDMLDMIWTKIGKKCPNWQFWGIPHPNLATL